MFELSPYKANPSILDTNVIKAEAYFSSAMSVNKRSRASAKTLPITPDVVIFYDGISSVRRGKYISLKYSFSNTKSTPKSMESYFSKTSLKFNPTF